MTYQAVQSMESLATSETTDGDFTVEQLDELVRQRLENIGPPESESYYVGIEQGALGFDGPIAESGPIFTPDGPGSATR